MFSLTGGEAASVSHLWHAKTVLRESVQDAVSASQPQASPASTCTGLSSSMSQGIILLLTSLYRIHRQDATIIQKAQSMEILSSRSKALGQQMVAKYFDLVIVASQKKRLWRQNLQLELGIPLRNRIETYISESGFL